MTSKVWKRIVPGRVWTQELLIDSTKGHHPPGYPNTMITWVTFDFKDMITCSALANPDHMVNPWLWNLDHMGNPWT